MTLYADMLHDGADPDELGERLANENAKLRASLAAAEGALAECREAAPSPPGHDTWSEFAEAVCCPLSVPGYVRRCVGEQSARLAAADRERDEAMEELKHAADHARLRVSLRHERDAALARVETLLDALNWAMGANGTFPFREEGQGAYWWRTELRERAGLVWVPEEEKYILQSALTAHGGEG